MWTDPLNITSKCFSIGLASSQRSWSNLLLWKNKRRQSQKWQQHRWFLWDTNKSQVKKIAAPTRLCRVGAVCLGEGSRAGASFAWVLLLARTPSPVVKLLAIRLLAASEHAHWPPSLFHHVHDAVQHLEDEGHTAFYWLRFEFEEADPNLISSHLIWSILHPLCWEVNAFQSNFDFWCY